MVRFARACMAKCRHLLVSLEIKLGPGTADLGMRTGIHSGPVTAGILRGGENVYSICIPPEALSSFICSVLNRFVLLLCHAIEKSRFQVNSEEVVGLQSRKIFIFLTAYCFVLSSSYSGTP